MPAWPAKVCLALRHADIKHPTTKLGAIHEVVVTVVHMKEGGAAGQSLAPGPFFVPFIISHFITWVARVLKIRGPVGLYVLL